MDNISKGTMETDMRSKLKKKRMSPSSGVSAYSLGVAKVILVNFEEHMVTLRIVLGEEQEFQRVPIPITYPGAGKRWFLGGMPMVGDHCVVGWTPQESGGSGDTVGTKIPVILSWVLPGVWTGQDWMTTQDFTHDEWSFSPKDSAFVEGAFHRTRHKLRHIQPGNIMMSSAQGSDLVLDDSVLITNRRANEILLRDPDQAIVMRSLQQFHAMAGTRIYAGMVQRDANFLPTQMFSDGLLWDQPSQTGVDLESGELGPVHEGDLDEDLLPDGFLTPSRIFRRSPTSDGSLTRPLMVTQDNVDPFSFLKRGLFIDEKGYITTDQNIPSAIYGGKPIYRTSIPQTREDEPTNAILSPDDQAFTEYRIEVTHAADGTLPVTEQTDNFDADRLPRSNPSGIDRDQNNINSPFIEYVLGTVVGNDPFTVQGRELYGIPLKPIIFDGSGKPNPHWVSALGSDLSSHAATLFQLKPPVGDNEAPTFWSVLKNGQVRLSLGGPTRENSFEGVMEGGLKLQVKGMTTLDFQGGLSIRPKKGDPVNNIGLELSSSNGATRIYGGAPLQTGGVVQRIAPAGSNSPNPAPDVQIEGRNTVEVKASQNILLRTANFEASGSQMSIQSMSSLDLQSGDRIGLSSKTLDINVAGKSSQNYSGPKDLLPTNGALREINFSTSLPGLTVDKYSVNLGNREETFDIGNHSTSIRVGDMTYQTQVGTWKAKAGTNELSMNTTTGLKGDVLVGNVTIEAKAGTTTISGTVSATMKTSGQATVSGSLGVFLGGGPVAKTGLIISSADLDPLSGLPFQTFGMGSPGHRIGSSI